MRLISAFLFCMSATAMAQEPVSAVPASDPLLETYQPEVSVSGNVVVGVMSASLANSILSNEISARSSVTSSDELCLRVASRDGIYTSKNTYTLPESPGGAVHLPYETKLDHVIEEYGMDEIVMAATVGDCDSGSAAYLLLAAVNDDTPSDVAIYVNSFGATDVFFEAGSDAEPCEYISEGRRTTYDFICRIGQIAGDRNQDVTIIRERFGREQPAVELTIVNTPQ